MGKKRGKEIVNKEEIAEVWCFECKDGGELMICDYKSKLPLCLVVFTWNGGETFLSFSEPDVDQQSTRYPGPRKELSSRPKRTQQAPSWESVDLRDRETYEGLFREYYEIVKEKEGFDKNSLLAAKVQLDKEKKICQISSDSDKRSEEEDECGEEEDEQLSSDNGDFSDGEPQKKRLKKKRCTQQKTKMQRRVKSKKKEFVGWGSKALIDFLQFIGQDTREKLSPYDVTSIITKYVKEHNLIHPVKKKRTLCDVRLQAVFGKKVVNRHRIFSLLESHFVKNEERLQKDELDHDCEDDDTEMLVSPKTEKKAEQNKISSFKYYSTAAHSQFAALIPENIKLIYLKRSLVLDMMKQPESIKTKIIGSFVRIKLDPCDYEQRNSHQLMQITGIKHGSSDKCNSEILIQVSNMERDVCLTKLSDDDFSKEECDDLTGKVKAGLLKKLTIVRKGSVSLTTLVFTLFQYLEKRKLLQQPVYLSFELQNIPGVIPEEVEFESLDGNGNQMQQTPTMQNIPGVTPKKVELEPLDKEEKDVNQVQQCSDETNSTKQNIPGVIPEEVELEPLVKAERDGNKMHQAQMRQDGATCSGSW
ncbi:hypothetical protein RND71_000576 [Anisodus tanguticus]|uniref:Uncharacterized protein n=1 Tax=Anisodus tanguticus TaxID=243964 RepID=A0AAE1VXM5_9SOLA|nr:hypothetical protein RND71_000576 [Anisodus tanguticus]